MGRCIWLFSIYAKYNNNHAIDHNKDNYIDLKNNEDAYPSAANYLKKLDGKRINLVFIELI